MYIDNILTQCPLHIWTSVFTSSGLGSISECRMFFPNCVSISDKVHVLLLYIKSTIIDLKMRKEKMEKNLQIFRLSILIIDCILRENLLFLKMRSPLVIIFFLCVTFSGKKNLHPIFVKLSDSILNKIAVKFLIWSSLPVLRYWRFYVLFPVHSFVFKKYQR